MIDSRLVQRCFPLAATPVTCQSDKIRRKRYKTFSTIACLVFCALLSSSVLAVPSSWEAGLAEVNITPHRSLWMAGYADRTKPSQGTLQNLYAKALALRDESGQRVVLVTTDLVGLPRVVSQKIARRIQQRYGLRRDQLLLNSSHTHGGPVVEGTDSMFFLGPRMSSAQRSAIGEYTGKLEDEIVEVVGAALGRLQPATISFGHGKADFAVNRRVKTPKGWIEGGANFKGPVDHDVPVLVVRDQHKKILGIIFGYACHNTTINGGPDFYKFNADYAGYAQQWLEKHHPGALAMFVQGCGGDQNPYPRGTAELALQHGEELGEAVEKASDDSLTPVSGSLKTAFRVFPIRFATPPTPQQLEGQAKSDNVYVRRHAEGLLKIIGQEGHLPSTYPYSLEVWQFGSDLTLVALAGECVVHYDLRLKKELGPENVWVAGYSNDVFAYIPSLRELQEGGYEGGGAMIYSLLPGPFAPSIEETIIREVRQVVGNLRKQSKATGTTS